MALNIVVPSVGESVTEGTVSQWLKKEGDYVRADEPVVELETEKATTPLSAPGPGRLVITVKEGATVKVGQVIGRVEEAAPPAAAAPEPTSKPTPRPQAAPARPPEVAEKQLSPAARYHADETGVDVSQIAGTGRGGRVLKEDVLAHAASRPEPVKKEAPPQPTEPAPPPTPAAPRERRERMSSIRQRIAERLVAAQQSAAILTTFNEADMSAVLALRATYKDAFQKKHGVGLGFMSFFVRACVEALREFPAVNARIDGTDIVYHDYQNIGVAVSTERGLLVPVLRDAQAMSFGEIEKKIADLAEKARQGKITVDDLQGGTFTITNGGVFGSLLSTPLLNTPQTGILGMHTIQKRPVVVDDQIVVRPMMYLALSYDHRLIDGREAVRFLVRVKECVEKPERLLLDV